MDIPLTWVGARDPAWQNLRTKRLEPGPILSLLQSRRFGAVHAALRADAYYCRHVIEVDDDPNTASPHSILESVDWA